MNQRSLTASRLACCLMVLAFAAPELRRGTTGALLVAQGQAPQPPRLEFTGPDSGFPPKVKGRSNVRPVPWKPIPGALTDAYADEIRRAALADARVQVQLGKRFAHISTSELELPKGQQRDTSGVSPVRLLFFSYTSNVAVEVRTRGLKVEIVRALPGYQPEEGRAEIAEAVGLARGDPRLRESVQGLEGIAILTQLRQGQPGYGHRTVYVTFTKSGEFTPRYWAGVDLTDQKVFAAGAVPRR